MTSIDGVIENTRSLYAAHPSVAYAQKIIDNLPGTTGRSIDEWSRLLAADGPDGTRERRAWLKTAHGLGGTTASLITSVTEGLSREDFNEDQYLEKAVEYVEELYAGKKAHLRPIHDALMALSISLGDDIRISPCKTMVPIYRNHVIAQIKPTTLTRVDFGLALKGTTETPPKSMIETGGLEKGDRITHRIPLSSEAEIDADLRHWLDVAYALDA